MTAWDEFELAAPEMAAEGRRLIYQFGEGQALLGTVRFGDVPRIHPINVGIVDGLLYAFVIGRSPKRADLETDGRYALHALIDPQAPSEFLVRGRATRITPRRQGRRCRPSGPSPSTPRTSCSSSPSNRRC